MKFSVVIPTFNYGHMLTTSIDSVLATGRQDIEILVVDDASTDDTSKIVRNYEGHITYIRRETNTGPAEAWAAGLAQARGDFVTKLDADDWVLPRFFDRVEAAFAGGAGMVISSVYDYREQENKCELRPVCRKDTWLDAKSFRNKLLSSFFFRMPGTALRRSLTVNEAPPERNLGLAHDWDYFVRVTRGHPAQLLAEPLAVYRLHNTSLTSQVRRGKLYGNDMEKLCQSIKDPDSPAYMHAGERIRFRSGLARGYLLITRPNLLKDGLRGALGKFTYAFRIAGNLRGITRTLVLATGSFFERNWRKSWSTSVRECPVNELLPSAEHG